MGVIEKGGTVVPGDSIIVVSPPGPQLPLLPA